VKRSQSCRSAQAAAAARRKISLVHFNPAMAQVESTCAHHHLWEVDDGTERLRNFESTKRGRIVNRGDSFRREQRKSSLKKEELLQALHAKRASEQSLSVLQRSVTLPVMPDPLREGADEARRVLLLGAAGVGKTALCRQFETSEYTNGCEQTPDYDEARRVVTVRLDGAETELTIEKQTTSVIEMPDEATVGSHDAFIIVYSVSDPASFASARGLCHAVSALGLARPVILVANKCDLVRLRKVTAKDGRALAVQFGFKYIETSVVINSNIDELLAGVVAQIRFYMQFEHPCSAVAATKRRQQRREKRIKSRTLPSMIVKEIFHKVLGQKESKSCQNLLSV